jgi:hypothetical protein
MSRLKTLLLFLAVVVLIALNVFIWRTVLSPILDRRTAAATTPAALPTPRPQQASSPTHTAAPTPTRVASATQPPTPTTAGPRTATPSVPASATPRPAAPQPTATPGLLTSIDEITGAVEAGRHGAPFRLVFSEQEISEELLGFVQSSGDITFTDLQLTLQQGYAGLSGKARISPFSISFKAKLTVAIVDGQPRLKVEQLDMLGGLVPGFIKDRLIQMIEQSADVPLLADLPVTIERVDIEPEQAIVTGNLR